MAYQQEAFHPFSSQQGLSCFLSHMAKGAPQSHVVPTYSAKAWWSSLVWLLHCNQGDLPPSYILGRSHSHFLGSKHGHSLLTYPWNQLKVIDMLNDHPEVSCKTVAMQNSSQWPCSTCPIPQLRPAGVRTSHIFNTSWTPWVLDPITNPYLGAPWLHPVSWIQEKGKEL